MINGEERRPTLRDVAEQAGVSVGTASGVLTGRGSAAERTRQVVLDAAETLGYRRHRRDPIVSSRVQTIGIIARAVHYPSQANPFYMAVMNGAQRAAAARGITLASEIIQPDRDELPLLVSRRQVDGLLILGYLDHDQIARLVAAGQPCVTIDHTSDHPLVDSVRADDRRGGYLATAHLIELGHTDPPPAIIVGLEELRPIAERLAGYRQALADHGLRFSARAVARAPDLSISGGQRAMRSLLDLTRPPTAVFCSNDSTALGALAALRDRGLASPADCSIVGYDDIDMAAHSAPPLTTIDVDQELLGAQGVWHLLQRAEWPQMPRRDTTVAVSLLERGSTAHRCVPTSGPRP